MSRGRPEPSVPTSLTTSETATKRDRCIATFDSLSNDSAQSAEKTHQQAKYLERVVQALSIASTNLRNGTVEDTSEIGCLLEVLQYCASKMIAERQNTLISGSLTGVQTTRETMNGNGVTGTTRSQVTGRGASSNVKPMEISPEHLGEIPFELARWKPKVFFADKAGSRGIDPKKWTSLQGASTRPIRLALCNRDLVMSFAWSGIHKAEGRTGMPIRWMWLTEGNAVGIYIPARRGSPNDLTLCAKVTLGAVSRTSVVATSAFSDCVQIWQRKVKRGRFGRPILHVIKPKVLNPGFGTWDKGYYPDEVISDSESEV